MHCSRTLQGELKRVNDGLLKVLKEYLMETGMNVKGVWRKEARG